MPDDAATHASEEPILDDPASIASPDGEPHVDRVTPARTVEAPGADEGAAPADGTEPVQRARTHGRLKTWVIVVLALLGVVAVTVASTYTPLFAADRVRVEGAGHLTADQVRRIARIQPGVNVVRLDEGTAERRLERNPWVADATITTQLPSGVTITIREQEPAALAVTDATGERSVLAGDGTILEPARGPALYPVVRAADGAEVPDESQRALGASVAASIPPSILGEVETVLVGGNGSVDLILIGGVPVSYGDGSSLAAKGQALRAVMGYADREGVRLASVSVRSPGAPTARLAGGTVVTPSG